MLRGDLFKVLAQRQLCVFVEPVGNRRRRYGSVNCLDLNSPMVPPIMWATRVSFRGTFGPKNKNRTHGHRACPREEVATAVLSRVVLRMIINNVVFIRCDKTSSRAKGGTRPVRLS